MNVVGNIGKSLPKASSSNKSREAIPIQGEPLGLSRGLLHK